MNSGEHATTHPSQNPSRASVVTRLVLGQVPPFVTLRRSSAWFGVVRPRLLRSRAVGAVNLIRAPSAPIA
jgi:hypothetical protein